VRREEVHERKMLVNEGGDPAVEAQQSSTLFFIRRKPRLRRYRLSTQHLAAPPQRRGDFAFLLKEKKCNTFMTDWVSATNLDNITRCIEKK
jgi:hypothetical protein